MSKNIERLLEEYRRVIESLFVQGNVQVILYGSYARGDYHRGSDVDIFVLADIAPEEISFYADKIYDITYDFEMGYDVEINPIVQSKRTYEQWKYAYPFFINIEKEGVVV